MTDLNVPRIIQETRGQQLLAATPISRVMLGTTVSTVLGGFIDDFYVKALWASNVGASNTTWTAHIVDDGGTASASNMIAKTISSNATTAPALILSEMILQNGQTLQMLAAAADSVQVWGWGYSFSGGTLA